jgi:hypothetical protein
VGDLAVGAVVGLKELHPRPVQLLAPLAERLGQRPRRPVAGGEQVPVRLSGRQAQRRRGAGIVLIGVAGLVVLANVFMRLGLQSERDWRREEARRR